MTARVPWTRGHDQRVGDDVAVSGKGSETGSPHVHTFACDGHCDGHVEEASQLRADLEKVTAERDAMHGEIERLQLRGDRFYATLCERTGMLNDLNAERDAMRAVVDAASAYQRAVKTLEAHEETCRDSPCDLCELYGGGVMEAEAAIFAALDAETNT